MRRLLLGCALFLACFTAACSGGGGISSGPPPTGGFTLASLKGGYAFSMSGTSVGTGAPISRIGSFIADGNGGITAGIEDFNSPGGVGAGTLSFTPAPTSNYTMNANGKGTLTLVNSTGTLKFTIALSTPNFGYIVETDGNSTVSGFFQLQTLSTTFSPAYAFDVTGVDLINNGISLSVIGQFTTNTTNGITGGFEDLNDDSTLTTKQAINAAAFGLDPNNGNGSTFGRGTITINGMSFAFYVIDSGHLLLIENDSQAALVGSATVQTSVPTTTAGLANSFVIDVGGSTGSASTLGALTRVGRFTSDASGNLTNVDLDQNISGTHLTFPKTTISNATLTIDPAGTGRGTVQFTDASSNATFSYVFYLTSATGGFLQDTSLNDIADGSISAQAAGPFTLSSLSGKYIVNWSGFNENNMFEEDFVGQYAQTSPTTSNIVGEVDYTEIGSNQIVTGAALNGTLTITGDGTRGGAMANTAVIQAGGQGLNFNVYVIDNNNLVLFGTDKHVTIGTITRQP